MGFVIEYQDKIDNNYRLIRNSGTRTPMFFTSKHEVEGFLVSARDFCKDINVIEVESEAEIRNLDMLSKNTFAKS